MLDQTRDWFSTAREDRARWRAPAEVVPRDPDLERLVRRDPDNEESLAVYADFLAGAGDSRGEVINAWLTSKTEGDARLGGAVEDWLRVHHRRLFPSSRLGGARWHTIWHSRGPLFDVWEGVRYATSGRGVLSAALDNVETVAMRAVHFRAGFDGYGFLDDLVDRPRPCPIRVLKLEWSWPLGGAPLRRLWGALGQVETLTLAGAMDDIGLVRAPGLKTLRLRETGLQGGFEGFELPALEELDLELATRLQDLDLDGLFGSQHLRRVSISTRFTGHGLRPMLEHPVSGRLRELRVVRRPGHGLPMFGAEQLIDAASLLTSLERLEVANISPAAHFALEQVYGERLAPMIDTNTWS